MMRRIAAQNSGAAFESIYKESPAHGQLWYINPVQARLQPAPEVRSIALFVLLAALLVLGHPFALHSQTRVRPASFPRTVIIDTDAGSDDLMAITFLLARPDIRVEAITIVNGMAHVQAGGRNVLRLLELAGRKDIPVFLGREAPLAGDAEFPAEWRRTSDDLPGVTLPDTTRGPEPRSAMEYLSKRLSDAGHPVQMLSLGPLTNLAEVFTRTTRTTHAIRQLVIMGGAVGVAGNLGDGGLFKTNNAAAEWNMFIDPTAAKTVFSSGVPIRLIPLDATQRVPVDMALLEQFQSHATTPLARFVAQVLATNRDSIKQAFYFARDPLAAVSLVNPAVATFRPMAIEISNQPSEVGRTVAVKDRRANCQVAIDADELRFRQSFMGALGVR
jgi:inosine-uridine nucleoside N-ribohydrolase